MILFIGSNPSHVAGVGDTLVHTGTKSGNRFSQWMTALNQTDYRVTNIVNFPTKNNRPLKLSDISGSRLQELILECADYEKIIALGTFPSRILKSLYIKHFKLPHPSPTNRQHNKPEFIREKLNECKKYITGELL